MDQPVKGSKISRDLARVAARVADRLWADENVLAIALTGSVEAGTAGPGSDVDLWLIERGDAEVWKGVYLREAGALVHLQYLSKAQFAEAAGGIGGRPFGRAVATSRLLRVRDEDVADLFRRAGELSARDRDLRVLEAAGNACFARYRLGKLLRGGRAVTPAPPGAADRSGIADRPAASDQPGTGPGPLHWRSVAAKLAEHLAKVALYERGVIPGRDPVAEAAPHDPELADASRGVLGDPARPWPEAAQVPDRLAQERLERNLGSWAKPVLDFLKSEGRPLSVSDFEEAPPFSKLETDFEQLLLELARRDLVRETRRPFQLTLSAGPVTDEVAYFAV